MKRICFYIVHPAPYRDRVLEEFCKDERYDVDIVYYRDIDEDHSEWNIELKRTDKIRYCEEVILLRRWGEYRPEAIRWFGEKEYDLVVVCGHHPYTSYRLIRLAQKRQIPYVYMCDTTQLPIDEHSVVKLNIVRKFFLKNMIKRAAALWVPGRAGHLYWKLFGQNCNIFEGSYTLDSEKLNVQWEQLPEKEVLKTQLGLPLESKTFLFIGKLIPTRNIEVLLDAFLKLKENMQSVSLIVIGDGEEEQKVLDYAKVMDTKSLLYIPRVQFADLVQYYKASDIYVHPGEEPYSLAVAQAALHGLPVIATDKVGAVYDYIKDGENGRVIMDITADKLAQTMFEVANHDEMLKKSDLRRIQMLSYRNVQWAVKELTSMVEGVLGND